MMCRRWFVFVGEVLSEQSICASIEQLYPVEVDHVAIEGGLVAVGFAMGSNVSYAYVGAALVGLGGRSVGPGGEPDERPVPAFARRPWREHAPVARLRIRWQAWAQRALR